MKKASLLFTMLLASIACWGQMDLEIDNSTFTGKIKTVKMTGSSFSEKEGSITGSSWYISFNDDGKIERMSSVKNGKRIFEEVYFYDRDGHLVKTHREVGEDVKQTRSYRYKDGGLVEIVNLRDGKEGSRFTLRNNAIGKPEEELQYQKDVFEGKNKYLYDVNGNRIERSRYAVNGVMIDKTLYAYDKNNNPVELKNFNKEGKLISTIRCAYEYDNRNNWTRRSLYRDEKLESENVLEITYR